MWVDDPPADSQWGVRVSDLLGAGWKVTCTLKVKRPTWLEVACGGLHLAQGPGQMGGLELSPWT